VTSVPWDAQGEAHAALRAIVADPRYGPPALSNAQIMTNLLKDMLPDAPRESSSSGPDGLRLTVTVMTAVAAILIVWACALPDLYVSGGNGRTSFSIFNSGGAGEWWFAVEPVGVAVIAVLAAVLAMAASRSARLRLLATGVLFGFGIQTVLLFAGYEFYVRSPDRAGPGGAVGILGGIVLLVAALIAAAGRPASAAVTSGSVSA
jgi:hypothetical protein